MMQIATSKITLPPPAPQPLGITIKERSIQITGSNADGPAVIVDVGFTGPVVVNSTPVANVVVSLTEVPLVGKPSQPATFTFSPAEHLQAVAADPAGFAVAEVSIQEVA